MRKRGYLDKEAGLTIGDEIWENAMVCERGKITPQQKRADKMLQIIQMAHREGKISEEQYRKQSEGIVEALFLKEKKTIRKKGARAKKRKKVYTDFKLY